MDVISLTRKLLSFNSVNPPGNEAGIARFSGEFLGSKGFSVRYYEFGHDRLHMIAEKGITEDTAPVVLSGHFDTVPAGASAWNHEPFGGEILGGLLYGRGSSDMKGALASMMLASVSSFEDGIPAGGVRLIFSAAEELGCQGISQLEADHLLPGEASAVIVGEPTGNIPAIGHKGAVYMKAVATGTTAHSSMPHLGDNAIYKAAEAIIRLRDSDFRAVNDPLLGQPTINIGMISGGMNLNSVPDRTEFTIDVRTTTKISNADIFNYVRKIAGESIRIEKITDLSPVSTDPKDPFVLTVIAACGGNVIPSALPYLTDGAVLQRRYKCPVVILGPGEPGQAHRTDEYCEIRKLEESQEIYKRIILNRDKKK